MGTVPPLAVLRTRRGLGLLAFATVMTIACVLLGLWQLDRYQQRGAQNDTVRAALEAEPVPFTSLVASGTDVESSVPDDAEGRRVEVSGTYDDDATITLRLRSVSGQSGVHVLTPLLLDDGRAVLVDRGFLPTASGAGLPQDGSVRVPAAAPGTVDLTARLRLSEDAGGAGLDDDTSPPSVRFVDLEDLATAFDVPLAPVWLERVDQVPAEDETLVTIPAPGLSSGPSLIYAVQWFLFGVIAVVGFVLLVRREGRPTTPAPDEDAPAPL